MGHPCVGIDLGTTYSALAVVNEAGRAEIVPNSEGERLTRSAVYFKEGGPIIVGEYARRAAGGYHDRLVQWVKREMGHEDWRFSVDGRSYSAVEISAMILRKVKQDAERELGPLQYAVVSVPAYFDEVRRVATIGAAQLAGLEVLKIVNEPTAAAIAYAARGGRPGTFLVYDFGGGTFDVSVVRVRGITSIEVIATAGDYKLGGRDLDKKLACEYARMFELETGVPAAHIKADGDSRHEFERRAEDSKHTLSKLTSIRQLLQHKGHHTQVTYGREQFEELIAEEIVRTQMLVDNALDDAELTTRQIDEVLLVGGSTRIPAVQAMLTRKFGKPAITGVNPDEAVALGAAIQAAIIMSERGTANLSPAVVAHLRRIRVADRMAHSLGTLAVCDVGGVERLRNVIIIPKQTPIPASGTETFYTKYDGQAAVDCSVTQGEDEDPRFVNLLFQRLLPLPSGRPAGQPIEVTYSYDADGRMRFEFKDVATGNCEVICSDAARRVQAEVEELEADFDDLEIE